MSVTKHIHDFTVKCDTYHLTDEIIDRVDESLKDFIDNRFWEVLHYSINETFTSIDFELDDDKLVFYCYRINEKSGNLEYDIMFKVDLSRTKTYIHANNRDLICISIYNYVVYRLLKEVNDNLIEKLDLDFIIFQR